MVFSTLGSHPASWAGKTYEEVKDVAAQDGSILVIPVGSVEQHGHHMPVATDTILADAMAKLGANRVAEDVPILLTPPVWSGYSPHHMSFGGTITLDHDDLLGTLEGIADTALDNGFDVLLLLNGHGGNASVVDSATNTIGHRHADVEVHSVVYFQLAASFYDDVRDTEPGGASHAGEFETSLMLHLRPELVHEDRIEGTNLAEPYEQGTQDLVVGGPLSTYRPFREYSESGAIGDPSEASAEKGAEIYDRLGDELEALLRQMHQHNR